MTEIGFPNKCFQVINVNVVACQKPPLIEEKKCSQFIMIGFKKQHQN